MSSGELQAHAETLQRRRNLQKQYQMVLRARGDRCYGRNAEAGRAGRARHRRQISTPVALGDGASTARACLENHSGDLPPVPRLRRRFGIVAEPMQRFQLLHSDGHGVRQDEEDHATVARRCGERAGVAIVGADRLGQKRLQDRCKFRRRAETDRQPVDDRSQGRVVAACPPGQYRDHVVLLRFRIGMNEMDLGGVLAPIDSVLTRYEKTNAAWPASSNGSVSCPEGMELANRQAARSAFGGAESLSDVVPPNSSYCGGGRAPRPITRSFRACLAHPVPQKLAP